MIVVRVRVGRGAFAYGPALQDCHFCDIGDERVGPFSPGVKIYPRTTATMQVNHPFNVDKLPRTKMISGRIVVTDQFNRTLGKRIRLGKFG